jgi:hypothetical protein
MDVKMRFDSMVLANVLSAAAVAGYVAFAGSSIP